MSCFMGHGPRCEGHPLPKTTLCGIPRCVVRCVVVVLCCVSLLCCVVCRCCVVFKIFVGASKIWALLLIPLSPTPPFPSLPSVGPPKISRFFPLRSIFALFLSLGVFSWNFGGVFESVPAIREPDEFEPGGLRQKVQNNSQSTEAQPSQFIDENIDCTVSAQRQNPNESNALQKTIEIPHFQRIQKNMEIPSLKNTVKVVDFNAENSEPKAGDAFTQTRLMPFGF